MAAPGHQMVNFPPVVGLIPARDEPKERCFVHELQELDGLVTGGATVDVQEEEQGRKNKALGGSGADGLGFRDMFPHLHARLQEVCDPPAGGVKHVDLGERGL